MNLIHSMLFLNKQKQNWLWSSAASCNNHPKTLSFRAKVDEDPLYINPNKEQPLVASELVLDHVTTLGSLFTNSSETASISSSSDCSEVETIVRGARSERLFFEPDSTSSIVESRQGSCRECSGGGVVEYEGSVVVVMETNNAYLDFKKSMEEMVDVHGLKDWDCMMELLRWYLKMNEKNNHEFIVEAFVDLLLVGFSGGDDDDTMASFSSAATHFCSDHVSSSNGD